MWDIYISINSKSSSLEIDFTNFSTDFKDFCVEIGFKYIYMAQIMFFRIFDSGGSVVRFKFTWISVGLSWKK